MATAAKRKTKATMRAEIIKWLGMGAGANPRSKTGRAICDELVAEGRAYKESDGYWATGSLRRAKRQATIGGSTPSRSTSKVAAKKRTAHKRKPDFAKGSLRWKFCMRLRELAQGRDTAELAKILGVSGDLARKYLGGTRVPTLDEFPAIAEAFGLPDWTDLFRPKNS
jgi:hypothetical protein